MRAGELVLNEIPFLKESDSVEEAVSIMDDCKVSHLAVVNQNHLLGIVNEIHLLDHLDKQNIEGLYDMKPDQFVRNNDHLFEVVQRMNELELTNLPVVNEKNGWFMGSISIRQLMDVISEMPVVKSPGGIIVMELPLRDYVMSEIARIVENNGAVLLGSFITRSPETSVIELTLKVNRSNVQAIVQNFERYSYKIVETYDESDALDTLRDRYDALMNYLKV